MREVAGALLGCDIRDCIAVGGGSLSQVWRLTLTNGECFIAKGGPNPAAEAEMLTAIRDADVPAPQVIAFDEQCLIIEELDTDGHLQNAWQDVGQELARLHSKIGTSYGWHCDYSFGQVHIGNEANTDWPKFWASQRLLTHLPHISSQFAHRVESLADRIAEYLPLTPQPSLLHGDCWGGNVLVSGRSLSGFIDPACYYGHAEVDLAMLGLFDQPSEDFYSAYGALEPGHEQRAAIYSLWPALVHLRLFGDGYAPMTNRFLKAAGH